MAIRVVIADDHPIVRSAMRTLLATLEGVELVGEAADGREALDLVHRSKPDVVIIDLQMPGMDGLAATREIVRVAAETAVLAFTMYDDDETVLSVLRAGARGYVVKGAEPEEIERAVRAVAAGEVILSAGVAARVLDKLSRPAAKQDEFPELTERERKILDLLAAGLANHVIAERVGIARKTVANNVSSILSKMQVADRAQAIIRARDAGLGGRTSP